MNLTSKHEVVTEDEEIDIDVDDDDPFDKSSHAKSIGFSISNILSDNFGPPKTVKIEGSESQSNQKTIFRPFEIKNFICNSSNPNQSSGGKPITVQKPSSIFLSNFRLTDIFDYSTKQASPQIKSDSSSLRNSLYNSLASYPKIHEEILNSSHKKNPNTRQSSPSNHSHSSTKIPPLGGLCKTISQIGQENVVQSTSPSLSTTAALPAPQLQLNSLKIQQSSISDASVDSDDCASEASTSKDESQKMWPAWVGRVFSVYLPCFCCSPETQIDLLCFSSSLAVNRFSAPDIPTDRVLVS